MNYETRKESTVVGSIRCFLVFVVYAPWYLHSYHEYENLVKFESWGS